MTRTYSRASWDEAQRLWKEGEFSEAWRPYRHQAAMRGMIYPPEGTAWDNWTDDNPSQRAIIYRAIEETPGVLRQAIDRAKSWGDVIAYVLRWRDDRYDDAAERERDERQRRQYDEPDQRQATVQLKQILDTISDS